MKNMFKNEIVLHDPYSDALCIHCVTGAVLTHDVMYPGFYFLKPPVSALYTNPQSPQNIHHPLFELYTTPEGGNILYQEKPNQTCLVIFDNDMNLP